MNKYIEFQKEQVKAAEIILLVYDVTDEESFTEIEKWFNMIKDNCYGR